MTKNKEDLKTYAVRIQNGQRGITVITESEEQPDMLALYRTFCSSTTFSNSDRLHQDFADWLCDLGWEKSFGAIFNVYDPALVRGRE